MSAKAGKTAEPNGVNIFEKTLEHPGGGGWTYEKKYLKVFFFKIFCFEFEKNIFKKNFEFF